MKRLRGGILQTCRQCVLGVTGKSETDHCCEVSFCILDKTQRDLFLGQEGRGPDCCCIAVDHRGKGGVFYHCPTICSESWRRANVALKYGPVFPGLALYSVLGKQITKYIEMTIYLVIWILFWPLVPML